ncbi:phosphomannomutase [Shewanella maritima]|uniref:Phosphomannomutase n=2 Tax=Shewanella maritima TaxID=2520507 RepID=A0A411PE82_9GAMM|nr:phosphomannomutase [Shewanella maritima]
MMAMLNTQTLLQSSNIAFGTSGARGLVTDFSNEVCSAFTHAFIDVMQAENKLDKIAIGIDNRPSSYQMAMACASAAIKAGVKVDFHGVLPTPALAFFALEQAIPCIMVTGSHIPFDRNGLKFYRPDGEITKADELAILSVDKGFDLVNELPKLEVDSRAVDAYINRYLSLFDGEQPLANKRIGIYEHSSAGRDIYRDIFERLGAEVISLGRTDTFVPIDTEAVAEEDIQRAKSWSDEHKLDAIFSTDGDGDRPLVADESGNWLRGDLLGLLCADSLNIEALAVPVSCNTALELSQAFNRVSRTRIGSPYVIAQFSELSKDYASVAGFEANGGFMLGSDIKVNNKLLKALPTRDAVLPALIVLAASAKAPVAEMLHRLPSRYTASDRIKNFETQRSKALLQSAEQKPQALLDALGIEQQVVNTDNTDGLRMSLNSGDVVHLRPSGNAPELRCYAESKHEDKAKLLVKHTLDAIVNIKI